MADSFENDENLDVLQNIEFAIMAAAREFPEADDYDVMHALDAALKDFRDLERGRAPKTHSFQGAPYAIFQGIMAVCDWRIGKRPNPGAEIQQPGNEKDLPVPQPLPAATLARCLKKIRKSVDNWHGVGGRRGYLEFIAKCFP